MLVSITGLFYGRLGRRGEEKTQLNCPRLNVSELMSSKYMRIWSIDLLSIYSAGYGLINLWGARWANLFKEGCGANISQGELKGQI
jgi:hypothetical protein